MGMGNMVGGIGMAVASGILQNDQRKRNERLDALLNKGKPPDKEDPGFMDWLKSKFSSSESAPKAAPVPAAAAPAAPASPSGDVGTLDRLKAGNIDQVGSEAYNRWGQGAKDLANEGSVTSPPGRKYTPEETAALDEMSRTQPTYTSTRIGDAPGQTPSAAPVSANPETFTSEQWSKAPAYQQPNPAWKDLPAEGV